MHPLLEIFSIAFLAAIIATPLLYFNVKFARALGLIEWPKARGLSQNQVPLVGASLVVLMISVMLGLNAFYDLSPWFIVTSTFVAAMGYLDDKKPIAPTEKMLFQLICVSAFVALDPQVHKAIIQPYGVWGAFAVIIFTVGMMNAVNFIDGIDGLAGIVLALGAAGFLAFHFVTPMLYPQFILNCVLIGALAPFFFVNVKLRRGFLGNIGSYFLSYCLVAMHVTLPIPAADVVSRLSLSGLCFLVPIADTLTVVMSRLFSFRSPFQPDKGHLHHRLMQTNIPLSWILFSFTCIELSALGVAILVTRNHAIKETILPGFICISHVAISAILILLIEKSSKRRIQAYFQRLDHGQPIYFLKYLITNTDGSAVSLPTLRRLEARVSAEIRVTDLCFAERPNTLFVTLKTLAEPLKGISSRLEIIFQDEKVATSLVIDHGEFIKVSRTNPSQNNPPGSDLKTA